MLNQELHHSNIILYIEFLVYRNDYEFIYHYILTLNIETWSCKVNFTRLKNAYSLSLQVPITY